MIEIKKSELQLLLITIAGYDKAGVMVTGLLTEKLSLGLKRKLTKLHAEAMKAYQEFTAELKDVNAISGNAEMETELKNLLAEVVKLTSEKVSLEMIEAVVTDQLYSTVIIDKIAE